MKRMLGQRRSPRLVKGLKTYGTNFLPRSSHKIWCGRGPWDVSGKKKATSATETAASAASRNLMFSIEGDDIDLLHTLPSGLDSSVSMQLCDRTVVYSVRTPAMTGAMVGPMRICLSETDFYTSRHSLHCKTNPSLSPFQ